MNAEKEPYFHLQFGEMIIVLSQNQDEPINPNARDPETNQLVYTKRKGTEGNEDNDLLEYDRKIDSLIKWSDRIAKNRKPNLPNLTVSRDKQRKRETHFRGTGNEEPARRRVKDPQQKNHPPEPQQRRAFSLIPVRVTLGETPEGSEEKQEQFIDPSELADVIMSLDQAREAQPLRGEGIEIEAIMPNWLVGPCSERGGTGGPGGIPVPYRGRSDDAHPFDFSHKPGLQEALTKAGEGVTVAVLDTAPCLKALADIYERYHKVDPKKQKEHHPLIESLLRPGGPLVVHPASHEELLRMRAIHLRDHNYDMTDHGLFVAGIIHSIAPKAKIHLYEVLNSQGVGDLMSIAQGFWRVFNSFAGEPLVVNCSLMLSYPLINQPIADLDPAFMSKIIKDWEKHKDEKWLTPELLSEEGQEWLARQGAAIEWICDQLYFRGSRVIAAAGNDWRREESPNRPDPRAPAAYDSVLGTGALPKNALPDESGFYPVSKYSNLSDKPESGSTEEEVGVVTLGGEEGEGNGVLGVYIGQFPDMKYRLGKYPWFLRPIMWVIFTLTWGNCIRPRNDSHWAWWSGTSFATPIISGLTAAMLSALNPPVSTQDAIDRMYDLDVIKKNLTTYKEDGVEGVKQI